MATTESQNTQQDDNVAVQAFSYIQNGQVDDAIALFADEAEFHNPLLPALKGKKNIGRVLSLVFGKMLHKAEFKDMRVCITGNVAMVERTEVFHFSQRVNMGVPIVATITIENGQIVEWRDYFDWATMVTATLKMGITLPFALLRR